MIYRANPRSEPNDLNFSCVKCCSLDMRIISSQGIYTCGNCGKPAKILRCKVCYHLEEICEVCYSKNRNYKTQKKPQKETIELDSGGFYVYGFVSGLILLLMVLLWHFFQPKEIPTPIETLRTKFPTQKNETWTHVLSALDKNVPAVKSLTLLYEGDNKTVNCLTRTLVYIYTKYKLIDNKEINFSRVEKDVQDYGEVLQKYRTYVKKHRILVTDLHIVTPSIARIFHTLCDEVSSDIKPSLFVFTLQYDKSISHLKRIERATNILRNKWESLTASDLFPLLSRVVKNVVEITPEKRVTC